MFVFPGSPTASCTGKEEKTMMSHSLKEGFLTPSSEVSVPSVGDRLGHWFQRGNYFELSLGTVQISVFQKGLNGSLLYNNFCI